METKPAKKSAMIVQTLSIIVFIAVSAFLIMRMISRESDSLSAFFIGFGICFVVIVLIAVYLNYISMLYSQIKKVAKNRNGKNHKTLQNEKQHMKALHIIKSEKKEK